MNNDKRLIPFIGGLAIGGLGGAAFNRYNYMPYYQYPVYQYPYYYPYQQQTLKYRLSGEFLSELFSRNFQNSLLIILNN